MAKTKRRNVKKGTSTKKMGQIVDVNTNIIMVEQKRT